VEVAGAFLEFGSGKKPFERGVGVERRKVLLAFGTGAGPAFCIVAMNGNGSGTIGAEFADAETWRSSNRTSAGTPGRGARAIGEQRREWVATLKAVLGG